MNALMSIGHERPNINIMSGESNEYDDFKSYKDYKDCWYGSANVKAENAFDMPSTPTTIANTDSSPQNLSESYSTYATESPTDEQAFDASAGSGQQTLHQMVVRAASVVDESLVGQTNHRRSNSGSEGAMHDLFSPTEGRECVNCGKQWNACLDLSNDCNAISHRFLTIF